MKVIIKMVKNKARENLFGVMDLNFKANLKIIWLMGMVFIHGKMEEFTTVNGKIIKCKGSENFLGLMEEYTLANIKMIKKKA